MLPASLASSIGAASRAMTRGSPGTSRNHIAAAAADRRHLRSDDGRCPHVLRALPHRLAHRAAIALRALIDVTDDAAGEHVLAIADVTGVGVGGRARQADAIKVGKATNARAVPADAGIIQHHAADAAFTRVESVVLAAVGA
jgi:hypothetical protein